MGTGASDRHRHQEAQQEANDGQCHLLHGIHWIPRLDLNLK
jgi:hypothetical protein